MIGICPRCGYLFEFATNISDGERTEPRAGDISFCMNCSAVNEFDGVGVVPTDESKLPEEIKEQIARVKLNWKAITGDPSLGAG